MSQNHPFLKALANEYGYSTVEGMLDGVSAVKRSLRAAPLDGGDGPATVFTVSVSGLRGSIQERHDAISAVYDDRRVELQAELEKADAFPAAVAEYHSTIAGLLEDGDIEPTDYANDFNTVKPGVVLPKFPRRTDKGEVTRRINILEEKKAAALKALADQLDVLGITTSESVEIAVVNYQAMLATPVPNKGSLGV